MHLQSDPSIPSRSTLLSPPSSTGWEPGSPDTSSLSILLLVHQQKQTRHQHHGGGFAGDKLWKPRSCAVLEPFIPSWAPRAPSLRVLAGFSSPSPPGAFPGRWSTGWVSQVGGHWLGHGRSGQVQSPPLFSPLVSFVFPETFSVPPSSFCSPVVGNSHPHGPGRLSLTTQCVVKAMNILKQQPCFSSFPH